MVKRGNKIKVISFDLDGTLVDSRKFDNTFWNEEIPKLYSKIHDIPILEGKKIVLRTYKEIGINNINWYRPEYWFKKFGLKYNWKKKLIDLKDLIKPFPEVKEILEKLSKKYKLIVLTQSTRYSAKLKLKITSIEKFFTKIFVVIEDFKMVKHDENVYTILLKKLNLKPNEIVHIGNDYKFDCHVPRSIGIRAILLDRSNDKNGEDVIHDLREIENVL
jgi:putative hydrolase of the HAD superfamily